MLRVLPPDSVGGGKGLNQDCITKNRKKYSINNRRKEEKQYSFLALPG